MTGTLESIAAGFRIGTEIAKQAGGRFDLSISTERASESIRRMFAMLDEACERAFAEGADFAFSPPELHQPDQFRPINIFEQQDVQFTVRAGPINADYFDPPEGWTVVRNPAKAPADG